MEKKTVKKMTDGELVKAWKRGRIWMMEVENDHKLWKTGLKRMEDIEDEMKKRKVGPWGKEK